MGYFKRVKGAFVGVLFGILLVPISLVVLGWNERDAVRQTGAITEMERVAIADVPATPWDAAHDGQLLHMRGECATEDVLEAPQLAIRETAIRLRWDSSIYQWTETERKRDDRTEYEYEQAWVDNVIDSTDFHQSGHSNDGSVKHFRDGQEQAQHVHLGEYELSPALIDQIGNAERHPIPDVSVHDIRPEGRLQGGVFYTGDPQQPQIGDEKIEVWKVAPRQDVTVMAQQQDRRFVAYPTKVGIPKEVLYMGLLTKEEVIERQRFAAAMKRWLFRGGGFLAMWVGLSLVLGPLRALVSGVPLLGRLVGGAIGLVTFLIALIVSSLTIAVCWFIVRPILSIVLIAVAVLCLFLLYRGKSDASHPTIPATA